MKMDPSGDSIERQEVEEDNKVSVDRIDLEDLPEPILVHILSFLPTKDALKASVLSKRWKYLWKSVNSFRFEEMPLCTRSERKLFRETVDRVLLLREPLDIHCFSLSCGVNYIYNNDHEDDNSDGDVDDDDYDNNGAARVNSWISVALNHKVKVLKLRLSLDVSFSFKQSLFTCESLTELKLQMFERLVLPSHICFPSLKILTIKFVAIVDEQSTNRLLSGCPVLEKLTFNECSFFVKTICISIPTLQTLLIYECVDDDNNCQVVITGKSLRTFDYSGELNNDYCLCDLSSLVDSSIVLSKIEEGREIEVAYRAHKLLKGLSNARDLYLTSDIMEVLNYTEELFTLTPVFKNLTFLRVNFGLVDFAWGALQNLLQNCPSLSALEFPKGLTLNTPGAIDDWEFDPVPSCFLTRLKTIYVGDYIKTQPEQCVACILLENAKVLESLILD